MGRVKRLAGLLLTTAVLLGWSESFAKWSIDFETGPVFAGYNDAKIPGDTGTKFSLSEELEMKSSYFFRVRFTHSINDRHHISALFAPLRLDASGQVNKPVSFNQVDFEAGASLKAKYRFDSYRLTYQYRFYRSKSFMAGLGLTAKIRDAAISLEDQNQKTEKKNTGFVPLINFGLKWMFAEKFGLLLEGDALAAPQGRAEDVLFAIDAKISDTVALKAGYRLLEGGADVDEVYTFALFHYIVVGATVVF
jgi:hypothetical protein